jgi:hypothetical protein
VELTKGKGEFALLLHKDEDSGMSVMATAWVDCDRKFFVSTCLSVAPGKAISCFQWQQVNKGINANLERMHICIPQPQLVETYSNLCAMIDRHNRQQQDNLDIQKKVMTVQWERRVNMGHFGMMVVDAYHVLAGVCNGVYSTTSRWSYEQLAEEMIDNDHNRMTFMIRREETKALERAIEENCGVLEPGKQRTTPTPTKQMKKNHPTHHLQGVCMVCKKNTTHVCRECQKFYASPTNKQYWICLEAFEMTNYELILMMYQYTIKFNACKSHMKFHM